MKNKILIKHIRDYANSIFDPKVTSSRFRVLNYEKLASTLEKKYTLNENITINKLEKLELSDRMLSKVKLFLQNNKTIDTNIYDELVDIMGIGKIKANELIEKGLTDIKELKEKKWQNELSDEVKLFIKLKPKTPIPNKHINILEKFLHKNIREHELIFTGSYRRKALSSNDIDIMLVDDNKNAINIIIDKLKGLFKKIWIYAQGQDKTSMLIDMSDLIDDSTRSKIIYKVDIFLCPVKDKIPMLLYSTGSKIFNINMRKLAKKKQLVLNQKGLFKKVDNKLVKIPNLNSEKDYFDYLGMKNYLPENRL